LEVRFLTGNESSALRRESVLAQCAARTRRAQGAATHGCWKEPIQ
jgi:hypothetical protein